MKFILVCCNKLAFFLMPIVEKLQGISFIIISPLLVKIDISRLFVISKFNIVLNTNTCFVATMTVVLNKVIFANITEPNADRTSYFYLP
jgi:Ni/Fe-hydrogenase subunit HybB-like protein